MSETELPNDLMRPREAAKLLGVHLATLYRWMDVGKLPFFRLGGYQRRVSRRDAAAMIQRETVEIPNRPTEKTAAERNRMAKSDLETLKRHGLDRWLK